MPHRDILAIYHQPDYDITIWQEWLDKINRRVHLVPIDAPEAAEAKIIIAWAPPQGALAKLPQLKGVISLAQGVDHILDDATFPKDLVLGRLIDPFMAQSMAAWVTLAILKQHRDDAAYQDAAKKRDWIRIEPKFASDFTVATIGDRGNRRACCRDHRRARFQRVGVVAEPKNLKKCHESHRHRRL